MSKWTTAQLARQDGRRFVVTGANTGIGYETAKELAAVGASVVLACRDGDRGRAAEASLADVGDVQYMHLDLSDLDSVKKFAKTVGKCDVLINNAGVMVPPEGKTEQGFELQWGVNVVGHFALTAQMWKRVSDRVVTLSSIAHRGAKIDFHNLCGERKYNPWREYKQSKLGDLVFALEMQSRLDAAGESRRSIPCHPGVSNTELSRSMGAAARIFTLMTQPAAQGALPTLYAATEDVPGGTYIGPAGGREMRGYPGPARIDKAAKLPGLGALLWETLETQSGVAFNL